MSRYTIETSKSSKGKCCSCKEPIMKREGTLRYGNYRWCYKCSLKAIENNIQGWKDKKEALEMENHHSLDKLNQAKIAKML